MNESKDRSTPIDSDSAGSGAYRVCSGLTSAAPDLLRALLDQRSTAGLCLTLIVDAELRLQLANRGFYDLCGMEPQETYGVPLNDLVCGAWNAPCLHTCLQQMVAAGGGVAEVEVPWKAAEPGPGTMRWRVTGSQGLASSPPWPWLLLVGEWIAAPEAVETTDVDRETAPAEAQNSLQLCRKRLQRLTSELVLAEEQARRQIATELHDRIGQGLAATQLQLGALRRTTEALPVQKSIDKLHDQIDKIIDDARNLTFEISPPVLYEVGLEAALEWLAEQYTQLYDLDVTVTSDGQVIPLDEDTRGLLFRSTRELLFNAIKHAQAERVVISVHRDADSVHVAVTDNGIGCDVAALEVHNSDGLGLFSIRERMDSLGGVLRLQSTPGQGMRCVLIAPLQQSG